MSSATATIFRTLSIHATSAPRHRNPHRNLLVSLSLKNASSVFFQQCKMVDASQGPSQVPDIPVVSDLRFNRILPTQEESDCEHKREFGNYVARAAIWGEEYWTAAWLRAEAKWEDQSDGRYVDSLKQQFADQVKKDPIERKNTALNCAVGTLDLDFRSLSSDETFPTVRDGATIASRTYTCNTAANKCGYVSNLCVRKSARRQGIASNMLLLAVQVAESHGVKDVFVHVRKDNIAAQQLYEKIGFQMVDVDVAHSSATQNYLMSFKA